VVEFSRILCPIDFSDLSIRALRFAASIATWYQAELIALHVVMPRISSWREPGPTPDSALLPFVGGRDDAMATLDRAVAQAGATGIVARRMIEEGSVHASIVASVASTQADLVVIGTHGAGGFHRLFLGSVTEKVIRTVACPVLTVPPSSADHADPTIHFKQILCPIDYSPSSLKALDYALQLGRQADGCVTVLNAIEYMEVIDAGGHVAPDIRRNYLRFVDDARERLHAQLAGESRTWCRIEEVVAVNRAYKEVLQRASADGTDVIVMGAHGHGGLELMLYGSNTHNVVRAAPCPVLTVRA
jgi:nucleotide-binding universal stress UspA family protein